MRYTPLVESRARRPSTRIYRSANEFGSNEQVDSYQSGVNGSSSEKTQSTRMGVPRRHQASITDVV